MGEVMEGKMCYGDSSGAVSGLKKASRVVSSN